MLSVAGAARGAYAELRRPARSWLDEQVHRAATRVRDSRRARSAAWKDVRTRIESAGDEIRNASDAHLTDAIDAMRGRLRAGGEQSGPLATGELARAFALTREVADRELGMRPYDVQLRAAWVLLQGMVAEMATGEGKTLAATPAAITMALAGAPTHVITVNDYLARRDAENMAPLFERFGLRVGVIQEGMSPAERREQYACDITYCTNKELAFDYLKDRITLGRVDSHCRLAVERIARESSRCDELILRGLWFGIVDEVDSVLVDEARTPLIISSPGGEASDTREIYETALSLTRELERDIHFRLDARTRRIDLLDPGRELLRDRGEQIGGLFRGERRRSDLVHQALVALHALEADRDYLVRDGQVQIIDEFTGRVMADRAWEQGLHQLVEVKEAVELTARRDPLARISYQRFFARYLRLSGMSGTAREVAGELRDVYGLHVVSIPTHRPIARRDLGEQVFATQHEKWRAVVERIADLHRVGRPVLIGTRSVAASESLGALLDAAGIPHRVLNARQDEREAEIVAEAGQLGRVTVATNMAGRGTDIGLGEGVAELGGLAVIGTERHEARRIDRQLFGRSGRQGDPGSCEMFVSFEDEIIAANTPAVDLARRGLAGAGNSLGSTAVRAAQLRAERANARTRRQLLRYDAELGNALAFSGRGE